jgi:hypothetical protein
MSNDTHVANDIGVMGVLLDNFHHHILLDVLKQNLANSDSNVHIELSRLKNIIEDVDNTLSVMLGYIPDPFNSDLYNSI